jgi:hypothetical protein
MDDGIQGGSRRRFLGVVLTAFLARPALAARAAGLEPAAPPTRYAVDVAMLYGVINLHVDGVVTEGVDRRAERYVVTVAGQGDDITNRLESRGLLRDGRWTPLESHSTFDVKGRQSRSDITYDWTRRTIAYKFRGETFFLRRVRVADDVVTVPGGMHVDDTISAMLNYADGSWPAQADGTLQTHVVRRKKPDDEGPDDVRGAYRAELVPLTLRMTSDPASGKATALFDLSRFSSWAKRSEPARITFGRDRRPELLALDMVLGTTVRAEMRYPGPRRP